MKNVGYKILFITLCLLGMNASLQAWGYTHTVKNSTDKLVKVTLKSIYEYPMNIAPWQTEEKDVALNCVNSVIVQEYDKDGTLTKKGCYLVIPPENNWCTGHKYEINMVGTAMQIVLTK